MKPLCIDLFCGLGGWTEGFLAEGFEVIGFDIERHIYGEHRYPAQLVLQDVRTLHGSQFKDATIIVASPPCQKYSYMAMPWTKAKERARWYRDPEHPERLDELNELFIQPARIQREACEAAGRYIPMIQENVKGAQPWVGRAQWHYGSYYLWGDVPALMPTPHRRRKSSHVPISEVPSGVGATSWFHGNSKHEARYYGESDGTKAPGLNWSNRELRGQDFTRHAGGSGHSKNPVHDGVKVAGFSGAAWFDETGKSASKSSARKSASARIAKIPFGLAQYIARVSREDVGRAAG